MKTIVVTGANGFIGSHLVKRLAKKNNKVIAISSKFHNHLFKNSKNLKKVKGNLINKKFVRKIIKKFKPNTIFHLAAKSSQVLSWKDPENTMKNNFISALNILNEIKNHKGIKLIFTSTSSVYSDSKSSISEKHFLSPTNPYGLSKFSVEHLLKIYQDAYKINYILIRPFFIIGINKINDVCSEWIRKVVKFKNKKKKILNVGLVSNIVRDFLDINDAIDALILIEKKGNNGEVYNISSGYGVKLLEIINIIRKLSKINFSLNIDKSKIRINDKKIIIGNNKKIKKLGWRRKVSLRKSLNKIYNYWDGN